MHASSFQGGYMDSDDDYDPPKDVIDRDVIESDDDVDRRPAAPGMLQRMRRESVPWYKRIGSNAWCAIALALAVAVWNLPQMVSGTGFFHLIAERVPALEPIASAVGKFAHLGVGFNPGVAAACTTATFKIVALCFIIGNLMRTNTLPRETPVVLSKLAFNVLLPCYMCTRVAATLELDAPDVVPRRATRERRSVRHPGRRVRRGAHVGVLRGARGGAADVVSRGVGGERRGNHRAIRGSIPGCRV